MPSRSCRGAAIPALLLALLSPPLPADEGLGTVVVTGTRPSLASAQEIKQESADVVDSIVADDIAKLPDLSVTEALSRVTGVQISRDRGEGGTVTIRGLGQMETTLDGRELFTAGAGRTLDFNDIPAELVAGIDVYKSSSADRIEGGVGGSIDLRTRRPFDFPGRELAATVGGLYGDLVGETRGRASLLASDRWQSGVGELGALLSLSRQDRPWREDWKSTGAPTVRSDLIPGQSAITPSADSETASAGRRERHGADLTLQWRPAPALELYAEGSYAELLTYQDSYQINLSASPTFVAGSPTLFPGTNDLRSITWTDAPVSILSFFRDTADRTVQGAVGGRWAGDALILTADLSHTASRNELLFAGPYFSATAPFFTQNLATAPPSTAIAGSDLLDPANLAYAGIAYRYLPFQGDLTAARLDGEYLLAGGPVESLAAGVRLARCGADNLPGLIFADAAVSGVGAADQPGYLIANPYPDLFPGQGAAGIGNFLVGDPSLPWDSAALRAVFGIATPIPAAGNPLGVWRIDEETRAAYAMANLAWETLPLDGNLGVRAVTTRESVAGNQSLPASGTVVPIAIDHAYTDYLPSLNLRYRLGDGLQLRGALSKGITRPDFSQLSPSLTLIRNSIDPSLNIGGAGNPELQPVRADNLDLALERYFDATTSLYATLFAKRVDGFVVTVSNPELHDGEIYQVSRPYNANSADVRGAEVGYQQFFDFLPGWLGGLGVQANYTYVESETRDATLGREVPLQNLSPHSANLIGLYERGRWSARVAYNWRDSYLSGVANLAGIGPQPVYTKGYGWLDASLTWRLRDDLSLTVAGSNLLDTVRRSYYGVESRPQSSWANDVQLSASVTVRF